MFSTAHPPALGGSMKTEGLQQLRTLPLFGPLTEEDIARLAGSADLQRYPKGTVLFEEGDEPDFLHVLLEGSVELFATGGQDRTMAVEIVWPIDSFILAAALTGTPYLMSARTIEPCRILMVPADGLRRQIAEDPRLSLTMIASLAGQYRAMVRQIKDLKLRNSTQRLGCFLLRLVKEAGGDGGARLPFGKRLLASRLGMTAENLSRALAVLREHGITVAGSRIVVTDRARIEAFCRPDRLIDEVERNLAIVPMPAERPERGGEQDDGSIA